MEQIITLKVDLEYPDEAHHAIDEAAKAYEESKSAGMPLKSTKPKAKHEPLCTTCAVKATV